MGSLAVVAAMSAAPRHREVACNMFPLCLHRRSSRVVRLLVGLLSFSGDICSERIDVVDWDNLFFLIASCYMIISSHVKSFSLYLTLVSYVIVPVLHSQI